MLSGGNLYKNKAAVIPFVFLWLLVSGAACAAEFKEVDVLRVDGAAVMQSSVTVLASTAPPVSLWGPSSAAPPHLYVSSGGLVSHGLPAPDGISGPAGARESNDSRKAPASDQLPDEGGLFQALSGNVGIGTKKPRVKLEVRGDVFITGELHVEGHGRKDRECRRVAFDASGEAVCGAGFSVAGVWKTDKGEYGTGGVICCR